MASAGGLGYPRAMGAALAVEPDAVEVEASTEDQVVTLSDVSWADYRRILAIRGDRGAPRLHFAEGRLEIMTPSRDHEGMKSRIGHLVEVYCLEAGIEFEAVGGWTLENKPARRAIEPDECYLFGTDRATATCPDLAIEVVRTSGATRKLDTYRALGVREVWIWRRGALAPYVLGPDGYVTATDSVVLPGLRLAQLAGFLDAPTASAAIRAYRDALRG